MTSSTATGTGTDGGASGRRFVSVLCSVLCATAVAVLLAAQLSLMSVLDTGRAERAAREIADSAFTGQLIEQTVEEAIAPMVDPAVAAQVAAVTSSDPRVRDVVRVSLISAHRQVVDPRSPNGSSTGSLATSTEQVQATIDEALAAAGAQSGVDLSGQSIRVDTTDVVPNDLPAVGLLLIAERTRAIAGVLAIVFGLIAVTVHPRPGRALGGIGWKLVIVCGAWVAALVAASWVIDRIDQTLFGEMLGSIWSNAVPSMLLLVVAGVVIGVGLWLGGLAVDGLNSERAPQTTRPSDGYS